MMKQFRLSLLLISCCTVFICSCGENNDEDYYYDNNTYLSAPYNLKATSTSSYIELTWTSVSGASYYQIYRSTSGYNSGYSFVDTTSSARYVDTSVVAGKMYYYKVKAVSSSTSSEFSYYAHAQLKTDSGGSGNTGGGSSSGGSTVKTPSAPTGVYAENYGNVSIPDVRVSWNSVSNATNYHVYRSTSASGSYSKLGSTSSTYYSDSSVKVGNTYYYKVKASNSAGTSDYSTYAKFEFKDTRKPGPVTYGNCTVSGTTMTLRWSAPSGSSYGKATKALLRVKHPDSDEYVTLQELSGTATSVSFTYTPWVHTSGYLDGYIYAGIILENENGTGGGTPKIYDNKNKKWMN